MALTMKKRGDEADNEILESANGTIWIESGRPCISSLETKLAEVEDLYDGKHGGDVDDDIDESANNVRWAVSGQPTVASLKAQLVELDDF